VIDNSGADVGASPLMEARRAPGQRLAAEYGQRVVDCLYDILDFVEMAANLTSAGRDRYDEDINLRLAGEAICHRMGEVAARLLHEGVDHRILWNPLVGEFPADAVTIRAMLRE